MPSELYEITNGPACSIAILREPDCFELAYRPLEPINEHFGAIMGDTVNNLREALDYAANSAMSAFTGKTIKGHFPFAEERKNLETSPHYPLVERTFPELAALISSEIEPCRDTNLHLWAAASLCNWNKHNDFIPISSMVNTGELDITLSSGGNRSFIRRLQISTDASKSMIFVTSGEPIQHNNKFSPSIEITFRKGTIFEDRLVIPTLTNMANSVTETLDMLELFLAKI